MRCRPDQEPKFVEEIISGNVVSKTYLICQIGKYCAFIPTGEAAEYIVLFCLKPYIAEEPECTQTPYINIFNQMLSTFRFLE